MERVKKGEKYWYIRNKFDTTILSFDVEWELENNGKFDDLLFNNGNYFHTKDEAVLMTSKLRAVLKGADVIEMPSEENIEEYCKCEDKRLAALNGAFVDKKHNGRLSYRISDDFRRGWYSGGSNMYKWLKSKSIK